MLFIATKWRNEFEKDTNNSCWSTLLPKRYVVCILMVLAQAVSYMLRFSIGLLITEMVITPDVTVDLVLDHENLYCPLVEETNSTSFFESPSYEHKGEFSWDEYTQGIILSSFFWGYLVAHLPVATVVGRVSGKQTLAFSVLVPAVGSLVTPAVARRAGAWGLVVVRIFMGLGQAFLMPSLNELLSKWAPVEERGRLGSIVFGGVFIGNVLSMFISGQVLSWTDGDWAAVFYLYGGSGLVWLVVWQLLGYSRPEDHPGLSPSERQYMEQYAETVNLKKDLPPTPWSQLLTSFPLWAAVVGVFGSNWGMFTIFSDLPKYMTTVLHFSIAQTGLWTALLYLFMLVGAWVSAMGVDYFLAKKITSVVNTRRIFATIALVGFSVSILFASFASCDHGVFLVSMVLALSMLGFECSSVKLNTLDLTTNYAGPAIALVNAGGALTGIISPYAVGLIVHDNTMQQWSHVFWLTAAVMVAADIVFVLAASGEIQPWNDPLAEEGERSSSSESFEMN